MRASIVAALSALLFGAHALADAGAVDRAVDLRSANALRQLEQTNPAHFERIRQILAGLSERPERVEEGWLQATFDARDVALSGLFIHTSVPPKQLLQFTLEDTRYTLYLRRPDMAGTFTPAHHP